MEGLDSAQVRLMAVTRKVARPRLVRRRTVIVNCGLWAFAYAVAGR